MKIKIISLIVVLFCSMQLSAQVHISFKKIPLNGSVSEYSKKLIKKGFSKVDEIGNTYVLKGKFINENCRVHVMGSQKRKEVWSVAAFFPKKISWTSLQCQYNEYKKLYQNKYGKGDSHEYFKKPYCEGDGYEMQALKKNKCVYFTVWKTDLGVMTLAISDENIIIMYEDKLNTIVHNKEKQEAANEDI